MYILYDLCVNWLDCDENMQKVLFLYQLFTTLGVLYDYQYSILYIIWVLIHPSLYLYGFNRTGAVSEWGSIQSIRSTTSSAAQY